MNFTLEELTEAVKLFSTHQCSFLTENCIVALESCNHKSGCKLEILGDKTDAALLEWSTEVKTAGYQEPRKYVEHGATAISFLLAQSFTEYRILEEATYGTGFDYWLGYDKNHVKYNPSNFLSARLEISGILRETPQNTLIERVKLKREQTNVSDSSKLPAYISVVEFSQPKVYFAKK